MRMREHVYAVLAMFLAALSGVAMGKGEYGVAVAGGLLCLLMALLTAACIVANAIDATARRSVSALTKAG